MEELAKEQLTKLLVDFKETGVITPCKLVGPPGTGKLFSTKELITSLGLTPLVIDCDHLVAGSVNEDTSGFLDNRDLKQCIVIFSGMERVIARRVEDEIIALAIDVNTKGFFSIFLETIF